MPEEANLSVPEPLYPLSDVGGNVVALISRDVLARLSLQYDQGCQEKQRSGVSQGMLLGPADQPDGGPWTIEKSKPAQGQAGHDPTQMLEQAAQLWEASSVSRLRLVGYYRCTAYLPETLLPKDIPAWKPVAGATRLMLVTGRRSDGVVLHRAFDLKSGKLLNDIPSDPAKLASSAPSAVAPAANSSPERPRPELARAASRRKSFGPWAVVASAVALVAAGAFSYWRSQPPPAATPPVVAAETPSVPPTVPAADPVPAAAEKPLGLEVSSERNDGYWRVSWNHAGQAVQQAVFGNLRVEDGDRQRDVTLGVEELRTGYILYQPDSDMVTMRLEVLGSDHKRVAEATRIMRANPRPAALEAPSLAEPDRANPRRSPAPRRNLPVKETRRLMIVTVHGPPRVVYMDRPEPPPVHQTAAAKIPATKPPSAEFPTYSSNSRQSQTASRQPSDQVQSGHQHKKPFLKRVFRFMKHPWSAGKG